MFHYSDVISSNYLICMSLDSRNWKVSKVEIRDMKLNQSQDAK